MHTVRILFLAVLFAVPAMQDALAANGVNKSSPTAIRRAMARKPVRYKRPGAHLPEIVKMDKRQFAALLKANPSMKKYYERKFRRYREIAAQRLLPSSWTFGLSLGLIEYGHLLQGIPGVGEALAPAALTLGFIGGGSAVAAVVKARHEAKQEATMMTLFAADKVPGVELTTRQKYLVAANTPERK